MMGISGSYGAGLQQAMLSANTAMMQAKVQSGMKGRLDGRAGVLKGELKQDGMTGGASQSKKDELERVQKASEDLTKAQAGTLEKANQAMQEAAKAEKEENKSAAAKDEKDKAGSLSKAKENEDGKKEEAEAAGSGLYTAEGRPAEKTDQPTLSLRA